MPPFLVELFARYGYGAVFFGVFLENAGLPVPGETLLLAGAVLAHTGQLSIERVIAVAIAAAILGDNMGFWIGRRGGRQLLEDHGPRVGLTASRLVHFDRFFLQHGAKTVFLARFITGLRVFGAVLAGASDLHWRRFLFFNATGALVWSVAVGIAGYALATSWETLERWVGRSGLAALVAVVLIAATVWWRRRPAPPLADA